MSGQALQPSIEAMSHLAAIIDSSDDAIVSKNLDGIVQSWNPGAERLFGYTAEEMVGKSIRTIIPPEKQTEEDEVLRRIRAGDRVDHFETVRLRKDGARVVISLTVSPVHDSEGRIVGASKVARDITGRMLTELQLAGERRAYELVAKGAPLRDVLTALIETLEAQGDGLRASILLLSKDGKRLEHAAAPSLPADYNRLIDGLAVGPIAGSCGTAAFRRESVIVTDIHSDPLWAPYPEFRAAALRAGLHACWSTPILSFSGKLLGTFAVYFGETRTPTPAQLQFTQTVSRTAANLIELRRAEDTRAHLASIVSSSEDGIIGMTLDGLVTSWSSGGERLYGYTAEEIVGNPIEMIIPEDARAFFWAKIAAIREGQSLPPFDAVRRHKNGRNVDVSIRLSPIMDDHGVFIGVSGIHRDISERKALERIQQEFLAIVTHELRTPLTTIKGFSLYLQRTREFNEEAIDTIAEQSNVLERLIDDLLDASRLQLGQLQIHPEDFDLVQELQACCSQARQVTTEHEIALSIPEHPVVGRWDAIRIRQVVTNLLINAIKYSGGGLISVKLEDQPDEVTVTVSDNGKGIAPEHLPRLFDRFYRGGSTGHSTRSLGLGLFIARGIVESHGGTITAFSEGEGRGSSFSFRLPHIAAPN